MRVLICGSRTFPRLDGLREVSLLVQGLAEHMIDELISGDEIVVLSGAAKGADGIADTIYEYIKIKVNNRFPGKAKYLLKRLRQVSIPYPAGLGKRGGPIRNTQLIRERPTVGYALIDKPLEESRGTYDMVKKLRGANIPTVIIDASGCPPSPIDPAPTAREQKKMQENFGKRRDMKVKRRRPRAIRRG